MIIALLLSMVIFKGRGQPQQKLGGGREQQPRRQQLGVAVTLHAAEIVYRWLPSQERHNLQQSKLDSDLTEFLLALGVVLLHRVLISLSYTFIISNFIL